MNNTIPQTIYRQDYTPSAWQIDTVNLRFELDETETRVQAELTMHGMAETPLVLYGRQMELLQIELDL